MKLPTGFQLIGQTTLKQYQDWLIYFDRQHRLESHYVSRKTMKAYARVGVRFFFLSLDSVSDYLVNQGFNVFQNWPN